MSLYTELSMPLDQFYTSFDLYLCCQTTFLNVLKDVYGKWLYHKVNLLYRYTAGVVGGLSAVAVCAPSDRFLSIGGPLAIGLGVVFASSLGK